MPTLRWLFIVLVTFTVTVAAQAAPAAPAPAAPVAAAAPTPERSIAARRQTITNGDYRSIHYSVDGLNTIEAVAYRRLEFLENEAERNGDLQHLDRLRIQNATQVERLVVPTLSIYSRNFRGYRYYPVQNSTYDSGSATAPMMQTLDDLGRAYLDVLNVERVRQGLPPLPVRVAAAVPTPAAPTPTTPTQTASTMRSPVAKQETNSNDALVRQVEAMQATVRTRLATALQVRNALGGVAGDLAEAPPAPGRPLPTPADVTPLSKDSPTFAGNAILPLAAAGCLAFFFLRRRPGLGIEA